MDEEKDGGDDGGGVGGAGGHNGNHKDKSENNGNMTSFDPNSSLSLSLCIYLGITIHQKAG